MEFKKIVFVAIVVLVMTIPSKSFTKRERLERLGNDELFDKIITKIMQFGRIPAMSAAIIKNKNITWAKGFGLYDVENEKEANKNTIYLVASISKTVTATAIMQLHEKGRFKLDDDVNEYLPFALRNPEYPNKPITFRMLLAHRSSLAEDPPAFYAYIPGDFPLPSYPYPWLKEYLVPGGINYKPQVWTDKPPGYEMNYANVGYAVLGYLVELLSNQSFEDYCQENIFKPLDMKNTSFHLSGVNISRVAVPYVLQNNKLYPLLQYGIIDYPAGGLRTTVVALSHFLIANMNDGIYNGVRILSKESIDEMHKIQYYGNNRYNFDYGLGWQIWKRGGETYIGHTGGLYGVATKMVFRKSDNVGIIYFMNRGVDGIKEWIAFSLMENLLFWKADGMKISELPNIFKIEEVMNENKNLLPKDCNLDEKNIYDAINSLRFNIINKK